MASLTQIMNGPQGDIYGNGIVRLGPSSGVPQAAREGVELAPAFVTRLQELVDSGVSEFPLQHLRGVLHIQVKTQLTPPAYAQVPSDDFCVLTFVTSPGRFTQFEVNLKRRVVTVARKSSPQYDKKKGFLICLGHMETMDLLPRLVREAKLQVMEWQVEADAVVGEAALQTGGQVRQVLGI